MPIEECVAKEEPIPCERACNQAPRQLTDKEKIKNLNKQLESSCERAERISSELYKAENKAQVLEEMLYEKSTRLKQEFDIQRRISKENESCKSALWEIYDLLDKKERRTDLEKDMLDIVKGALEIRD